MTVSGQNDKNEENMMNKGIITIGTLCATLLLSTEVMAKPVARITLTNTSKPKIEVSVDYRIAHQNKGGKIQFSSQRHVTLTKKSNIDVDLAGYQYAGIVPTKINGHTLPNRDSTFGKANACSITVDKNHLSGTLGFNLVNRTPKHGTLTCHKAGGTLI